MVDYPSIKIDDSIDFNTAPSPLGFLEKDKVLKIFISQSKIHKLIPALINNAETEKDVNYVGQTVIKTIIDNKSKKEVLDCLISDSSEYGPLFNHYKKFIMDSEIFFQQIQNDGKGNKEQEQKERDKEQEQDENENESEQQNSSSDKNKKKEDKNKSSGSKSEAKKKKENKENKSESDSKSGGKKEDKKEDKKESKSQKLTPKEVDANESKFKDALEKTTERKIKFKSLSGFDASTTIEIQEPSTKTRFSKKEKDIADRLVNMLDISFDPTEDTVKNLRLGKLDITKIAEVPAGNIAIYKQTVENQTTKPFSVAILCDESGSMTNYYNEEYDVSKLDAQYSIVKSLYHCFSDILPQDKIFIYGHTDTDDSAPALFIYQDKYNHNFVNTIDNMMDRSNGENYDGPIIEEVYKQIRNFTNDRIIFIVLSDGMPNGNNYGGPKDIRKMKQIIEKCKRDDFVTIGIGIKAFHVQGLYQYSAIVEELDEMPKKVSHIVNHVVKTEFQ